MNLSVKSLNVNPGDRALATVIVLGLLVTLPGCGIPPLRGPEPGAMLPKRFEDANNLNDIGVMPGAEDYMQGPPPGAAPGTLPVPPAPGTVPAPPASPDTDPNSASADMGVVRRGMLASVTKPALWFIRNDAGEPDVGTTIVAGYASSATGDSDDDASNPDDGAVRLAVGIDAVDDEATESDDGALPAPGASVEGDDRAATPGDGAVPSTESDEGENGAAGAGHAIVPPPGQVNGSGEFGGAGNSSYISYYDFFNDPVLAGLISQALTGNQELKILTQEIQIANFEVLGRSGTYLPFVTLGKLIGLDKPSRYTPMGAVEEQLNVLPGKSFPDPLPDFMVAADVSWEIDIWRKLRNARDAATFRYLGTRDGQNYVVTRLIAEVAENYYELLALDNRLTILDQTIAIQQQSLRVAQFKKAAGTGTELGVQRFMAEVRKNQSEKLIVQQRVIEVENRINFLLGRYPQHVERQSADFIDRNLHALSVGVPSQLLRNRADVRQAERELAATGLDVRVARARFFPSLVLTGGVGLEAFNPRYLFTTPEALIYNVAGEMVTPLINRRAIRADYLTANATQLEAVYKYQRTILNAFTEVINRMAKVQNYSGSIEIKKQQLESLQASVQAATNLFDQGQVEYVDVLLAQRDLMEARMVLVETKQQELSAIVNAYQALGGGGMQMYPQQ